MIGQTVSHYKILSKLGAGGMGVVYQAEDTRLKRTVALKFLPPELTRDEAAKTRFIHEARAASALQHHNICTIHEIDETADGQLFIAMDCYAGETLKERIARGPLPVDEAVDIAGQVAAGLSKAHAAGMVHRDLKPANIMVTSDGVVKILDFGLAKLAGSTKVTKTGMTVGTVAYMSPEQAKGEEVDARSDIFSLGAVFYEMLTGKVPFPGEHEAAVLYGIINNEPKPLAEINRSLPQELQEILDGTLAKDPNGRYPGVSAMLEDLSRFAGGTNRTSARRRRVRRRVLLLSVASASVLMTGAVFLVRYFSGGSGPTSGQRTMIAVLPFENLGPPDDEYFASGTMDAISARLAGVRGLGVISRQSAIQYKKSTKSIRQIGSELGVDYILEGTVQRERPGDPTSRVRVIPQLVRVADETNVWAETYDNEMTEVFRVQSDIAERVATQLNVTLLATERRAIERRPTENLAAYEEYLRGMDYYYATGSRREAEQSAAAFKKAVELDPQFAEAWAWLSLAYHALYWMFDAPEALGPEIESAERARVLGPDLPETHLALGRVAYARREFDKALEHFEAAQRVQPSGDAAYAAGMALRRLGRWEDALDQYEEARRLLPRSYMILQDALGVTNCYMRRFDEAERWLGEAMALAPHLAPAYRYGGQVAAGRNGDVDAAQRVVAAMLLRVNSDDVVLEAFGADNAVLLRLCPEPYAEVCDAYEFAGTTGAHRVKKRSLGTEETLARAIVYEAMGDTRSAIEHYDSARVHLEHDIRSNPQSASIATYHSRLGRALAGLGRCDEAIREGETAVKMIPISQDAITGMTLVTNLAEIYVKCGKYDEAIGQVETLLSVPSFITPALLRVDPIWEPIRDNPRFRRLAEGK